MKPTSPRCGLCDSMLVAANGVSIPNNSGCMEGWCGRRNESWTPGPPPPRRPDPISPTASETKSVALAVGTLGLYPLARAFRRRSQKVAVRQEADRYAMRKAGRDRYEQEQRDRAGRAQYEEQMRQQRRKS